jgi:hypothetical protein
MSRLFLFVVFAFFSQYILLAQLTYPQYVSDIQGDGYFPIKNGNGATPLWISSSDFPGVLRAAGNLQDDVFKVSGIKPGLFVDKAPDAKQVIIAGTIGKSALIDGFGGQKAD